MAEFNVTAIKENVDFFPATMEAEVIQNVRTILRTRKGSVPLDRKKGLDWNFMDKPLPVAQAALSTDVIQQVNKYEPRAKVLRVGFDESQADDGRLIPRVVIGVEA